MFKTELAVRHVNGELWRLTEPLVWEGSQELMIVQAGFETDFASIPKAVRWLMDTSGVNSEAAVLHDAVYQESKQPLPGRRVDPADADGIFRRALRETGSTALTRGLMWGAVRAKSIKKGRYGEKGPSPMVKLAQLAAIAIIAVFVVIGPSLAAFAGLGFYWVANWIAALSFQAYERRRFPNEDLPNWPYPSSKPETLRTAYEIRDLVVLPLKSQPAQVVLAAIDPDVKRVSSETVNAAANAAL